MKQALSPLDFRRLAHVEPERLQPLADYLIMLQKWQGRINLVGPGTMGDPWRRHFLDSAQLVPLLPPGRPRVVDLGSGAGFPGMVLAMLTDARVELIESNRRKCVFLGEVAHATGTPVTIHNQRIESMAGLGADVVVARACAPLDGLLGYAAPILAPSGLCLFLKGRAVDAELTEAERSWKMRVRRIPSRSDGSGTILKIEGLSRRDAQ